MSASDVISRRNNILKIIVEAYIDTAAPVGSRTISRKIGNSLSPATVRNVMSDLEEMGFLTHPHTSAGRVPTEKGYRYYIDELMGELPLLNEEKTAIGAAFKSKIEEMDKTVAIACRELSLMTNEMVAVSYRLNEANSTFEVVHFEGSSNMLNQPEFQNIEALRFLFDILERRSPIFEFMTSPLQLDLDKKITVRIGHENGADALGSLSTINSYCTVKGKPFGKLSVIGPIRMNYKKSVPCVKCVSEALSDFFSEIL